MKNNLPQDMGHLHIFPTEYCYIRNMIVSKPSEDYFNVPRNLSFCRDFLNMTKENESDFKDSYCLLTCIYGWVNKYGNSPGWHIDGFNSNSNVYLWYDVIPTEFYSREYEIDETKELKTVLRELETLDNSIITYPSKHVLKLNKSVIHRAGKAPEGMNRLFVRATYTENPIYQKGNAFNPLYGYSWERILYGQ